MSGINLQTLNAIMSARMLDEEELAGRIGLDWRDLEVELTRDKGPTKDVLGRVARELGVPIFTLFSSRPPILEGPLIDFRARTPGAAALSRQAAAAVDLARSLQRAAKKLRTNESATLPDQLSTEDISSASAAIEIRRFFEIEDRFQLESKNTREFFTYVRQRIEAKGVFILQDSLSEDASGITVFDHAFPAIIINTFNQTPGRRLFTLAHELGHLLLRTSAVSKALQSTNRTERDCDRFAAKFLAPQALVRATAKSFGVPRNPTQWQIARISNTLKLSREATVLRLEQLNLVDAGFYQRWRREAEARGHPDIPKKRKGGRRVDPKLTKLAKYGFFTARVLGESARRELLSPLEIYRISGIKPQYQNEYFEYASVVSISEAANADEASE